MGFEKNKLTLDLDRELEIRLKIAAKLKGVSVDEYCQSAIGEQLIKDQVSVLSLGEFDWEAFERMIALRKKMFGGKRLPGDSVDLLREAREIRDAQLEGRA